MRILTRYILKTHVGPFVFSLSVLTGILMINTVARRLEALAGKGLPWSVMAEVFVLSLPHILALTLPMAVLVATLYAFSALAADNEITALKASGVNLNRTLVPLLVVAVLFGGGMMWFNDYLLPETNHQLKILLLDIQRKTPTLSLKEQTINPIRTSGSARPKYYLQAAEITPATNRLKDVVIYDFSEPRRERSVYADSGQMAINGDQTDLFLTLYDGWINQLDNDTPERFVRSFFDQYRIQIRGVGNELTRSDSSASRSDREMSLAMLRHRAVESELKRDTLKTQLAQLSTSVVNRILDGPSENELGRDRPGRRLAAWQERMPVTASGDTVFDEYVRRTFVEVSSLNARAQQLVRLADSYMVEYHKKFAISWAVIVFVLLGAPIAVRFPRGGVGLVIAVSIAIFAVYYAGLIGGESLADDAAISPWAAMWAPNILFLLVAVWGLMQIGKEAATTRGGGWDDLLQSLRTLVMRPIRLLRRPLRLAGRKEGSA